MMNAPQPPTAPNAPAAPQQPMGAIVPSDISSHIEDLADTHTMEQLQQKNSVAPSTINVLAMELLQGELDSYARELTLAQAAKQKEAGPTGTIAERKPAELRNSVDEINRILGSGATPMQRPQGQTQMAAQGGIIGYAQGTPNPNEPEMDQDSFIAEYGQEALDLIDEYPEAANILGLGVNVSTARGLMAAQPIITGAVLKDPRKVIQALSALKDVKLKDIQNFGTKALDRLRTWKGPKKGEKGKTREERGSEERFDAERARLEAERRAGGPQTVKDFPDTAKPRVSGTLGPPSSGPSQTVLKGGEQIPKGQGLSRTKDNLLPEEALAARKGIMSRMGDKWSNLSPAKKIGLGGAGAGALAYGLSSLLSDDEERPDYVPDLEEDAPEMVEAYGQMMKGSTVPAKDTGLYPSDTPFDIVSKQFGAEDKDFIAQGKAGSPTAEERIGPMFDRYKEDLGIDVMQKGVDAAKNYLSSLGRDEKLEKVNEIFANYNESFEKLYSDEKLSRQRRMAAFSNATGDSVGQVLANMQKGFLATEKAQDVIITAHLNKIAGNELYALELDINMFDKGQERAKAAELIAAADLRQAKEIMAAASREEKQGWLAYAKELRQTDDNRINNWMDMVRQYAADYRAMDARDLAEVTTANEYATMMDSLRYSGFDAHATSDTTLGETYRELITTLQEVMAEGKDLLPAEQRALDSAKKAIRMVVESRLQPEDRAKETAARATIAKYKQQEKLGPTERALSALGAS